MAGKYSSSYKKTIRKKGLVIQLRRALSRALGPKYEGLIIKELERGNSPVRGKRFRDYAPSYINAMLTRSLQSKANPPPKGPSPVNLRLSSKMYRSVYSRPASGGRIVRVGFKDPKSRYHDVLGVRRGRGGRQRVIRRILPRGVEQFSRPIDSAIDLLTRKIARLVLLKARNRLR